MLRDGFFFRVLTGLLRMEELFKSLVVLLFIGLIELDVFSDQPIAFFGNEADLIEREVLFIQGCDLNEVSEVSFDTGFGVIGF